jgi:hypothetical protein
MRTLRENSNAGKNVGLLKNIPKVIDLEASLKGRNNNKMITSNTPYYIFNDCRSRLSPVNETIKVKK